MQDFLWELYEMSQKATQIVPDKATWYQKYEAICRQADQEEPAIQKALGKPRNTKGGVPPSRNLLNRLNLHQTGVLAFAFEEGVPFTNNAAENDIRNLKIKQKVAMSFLTTLGARVYARIQACLKTFRKKGLNLFKTLVKVQHKQNIILKKDNT